MRVVSTHLLLILLALFAFLIYQGSVYSAQEELIIRKLVEKGVLSEAEAKALLEELSKASEKEQTKQRQYTKQVAQEEVKANVPSIPKWVQNVSLKGDLRLRYQTDDRDNDTYASRDRARIRWRLGMESNINPQWLAGFGLCSGGADPRSTNQTLQDTFQSPDARLDYAFVNYKPLEELSLVGGKFKNSLWEPKDLLWDTDIMPDGLSVVYKPKFGGFLKPWFVSSLYILDEYSKDANDPFLFVLQAGIEYKVSDMITIKLSPTYYNFSNLNGNTLDHRSVGNSVKDYTNNRLIYDYDSFTVMGGIVFTISPLKLSLFGEYVNSNADKNDSGYLFGLGLGTPKLSKLGDWEFKYNYRKLKRDAWPDALPDSDFYNGATNVKGHEVELTFGLAKNVTIGLDFYKSKPIETITDNITNPAKPKTIMDPKNEENLLQVDLVVKW